MMENLPSKHKALNSEFKPQYCQKKKDKIEDRITAGVA
jgi:hypothetical protein